MFEQQKLVASIIQDLLLVIHTSEQVVTSSDRHDEAVLHLCLNQVHEVYEVGSYWKIMVTSLVAQK